MAKTGREFLLIEPLAKTRYPPLGLMKISTWLKKRYPGCKVVGIVGTNLPRRLSRPDSIFITTLFAWDLDKVVRVVRFYTDRFPDARVRVGGVAASLLPDHVEAETGIRPHVGLIRGAEKCRPDYSLTFGRALDASITFASRGCPRKCPFCSVAIHEPVFEVRENWEKDIHPGFPRIVFWDNNWLASPRFSDDAKKLRRLGKIVDFNQGLDARLYDEAVARELSAIKLRPIRFAFDSVGVEKYVIKAISIAKQHPKAEIRVYVLYNFDDTPEDLYYRLRLLNRKGVLAFPMEYRQPIPSRKKFPGPHWNTALLRAMKLTLLYYYRKGMITESRRSFHSIYGKTSKEFVDRLYSIYEYDKSLKR
ncbi:hypothetical protein E3J62_10825 [candidate division TA06 bacterium]|uniref:Radical SAM protein n=1 Tax=candidate division TA06 bacterium TaxID=2250710 RepID=A0A523UP56_UNCT6|nr:MAG: hypothetical protein E3J62_10825 [candidate division TA06 bacterium]